MVKRRLKHVREEREQPAQCRRTFLTGINASDDSLVIIIAARDEVLVAPSPG